MNINYPPTILRNPGMRQAFKLAVLHGLCYRMNSDTTPRKRINNHMYGIGYWSGRVSAFKQTKPYAIGHDVNFHEEVISEVNRLEKEIIESKD